MLVADWCNARVFFSEMTKSIIANNDYLVYGFWH